MLVAPTDPVDLVEHLLFSTLLPEVALNPSKPIKTAPILILFSWTCGGQGCLDDFIILSFYRPEKACKTSEM